VVVSHGVNPLYRRVTATYCGGPRIRLREAGAPGGTTDLAAATRLCGPKTAALVVQSPNVYGCLEDIASAAEIAHAAGALLVVVSHGVNPLYRRVTATYCGGPRIRLREAGAPGGTTDLAAATRLCGPKTAALVVQSPNFYGCLEDIASAAEIAHAAGALLIVVAAPVNLGVPAAPGKPGAHPAVGEREG